MKSEYNSMRLPRENQAATPVNTDNQNILFEVTKFVGDCYIPANDSYNKYKLIFFLPCICYLLELGNKYLIQINYLPLLFHLFLLLETGSHYVPWWSGTCCVTRLV